MTSLKAKKQVNYVESASEGEDGDEQISRPGRRNNVRNKAKRRKPSPESDDDFEQSHDVGGYSDDGQLGSVPRRQKSADWSRYGRFHSCG